VHRRSQRSAFNARTFILKKYWQETAAVAQRILTELFRRKRSLISWVFFPISILLLNGYLLAEQTELSLAEAFASSAPSTLVGSALFFSCLGGSVSTVVSEREQQTLKRLFISPLSGFSYFLGIFAAYSYIGIGQTLVVYATASILGAEFDGSLWLAIAIVLLSIASYVGIGFILGTQLARRTEDVNSLVAAFGVPLLILGGAFVPTQFFPDTLLRLAEYNPIYHMIEALTSVSAEGNALSDAASSVWFLAGFAGLMVAAGWLSYQRMIYTERRL
jgi:ABC-2 type transport system permease protein